MAEAFEALIKPLQAVLRAGAGRNMKTLVGYLHDLKPPGLGAR